MDKVEQIITVNEVIADVLNKFVYKQNTEENRRSIGYEINKELTKLEIDYEGLNLHTPPVEIDRGNVRIAIDDDVYPISIKNRIKPENVQCLHAAFLKGSLDDDSVTVFFQYLIDNKIEIDMRISHLIDEMVENGVIKKKKEV